MVHRSDAKLAKLETATGLTGDVDDLESYWLKSILDALSSLSELFSTYADQTAFDVDWTRGAGATFDATNDEVDYDGTQGAASQTTRAIATITGQVYTITANANTVTAGQVKIGATGVGSSAYTDAAGQLTYVFIATGASTTVYIEGDVDFIGSVSLFESWFATMHIFDLWHSYWDTLSIAAGDYNDRAYAWLGGLGHAGSLPDRWELYWNA